MCANTKFAFFNLRRSLENPLLVVNSWTVHATMDLVYCTATVDFNVPGKSNPPPVTLLATVWKQTRYLTTGVLHKNAIEFTDPSGTLALPSVPLKTWVQMEKTFVREYDFPDVEPRGCFEPHGSLMAFKDQRDDDSKLIAIFNNDVTLTPFGTSDRFCIYLFNVCFSIGFTVMIQYAYVVRKGICGEVVRVCSCFAILLHHTFL